MATRNKQRLTLTAFSLLWLWAGGSLLFGQTTLPLRGSTRVTVEEASFPHGTEKHRSLECGKCHQISTLKPDVKEFPGHAVCLGCHNLALEAVTRAERYCGVCHKHERLTKAQPALFPFPKPLPAGDFGANFSHPSHLKPTAVAPVALSPAMPAAGSMTPRCTDCHKLAERVSSQQPDISKATGHPACFKCHGERPAKPPSMFQCVECHKLQGPRSPHLFGSVKDFRHQDHAIDIRPRKKADFAKARPADLLCMECHQSAVTATSLKDIRLPEENTCMLCHTGKLGQPEILVRTVLDGLRKK